jgi:hypothetical protein
MYRIRTASLIAAIVLLLTIGVYAVHDLMQPPFSDAEIRASLVDTWEVEAWSVVLLSAVVVPVLVLGAVLTRRGNRTSRQLAWATVALAVVAEGAILASHVSLTERTTTITGQHFGGFYGLP